MAFQQEDFVYHDLFGENSYLEDILTHYCASESIESIKEDLAQFSKKASKEILELMWQAEKAQPQLVQFDHWGKRIDHIEVSHAWNELHRVSAREGIVSIGYERKSGPSSRLHQFLKLMIYQPSSATYTCPLAMTDGAARVLELENGALKEKYFSNLISRDEERFWTAGQWMTEKTGGSDVSKSETRAEVRDGRYFLYGTKWFTSAITANIAMALAQTEVEGQQKLSLFLIEIRDESGKLNNIEVLRLKEKLGTKAMPTAELELNGVEGFLIGELGKGVKNIATILNISRLYNSVCATGTIYRLQSLIRDYSNKREAFGKKLIDHCLHQETLLKTQADTNACVHFISELGVLLGKSETDEATEVEQSVLRLMTPIAKLWTGKKSILTTSELLEAFGGAGYIEDTQLPRFLRDAQVFPIWEGTTNIMSLDTLRALSKEEIFSQSIQYFSGKLNSISESNEKLQLQNFMDMLVEWVSRNKSNPHDLERGARTFAFALGDLFCGLLMLQFADRTKKQRDINLAQYYVSQIKTPLFIQSKGRSEFARETLLF